MKGSENGESVSKWMNYLYDPVNAARLTSFVQFWPTVKGVREELVKMGSESAALAENPLVFPDDVTFKKLQTWGTLSEIEETKFDERFASITGA